MSTKTEDCFKFSPAKSLKIYFLWSSVDKFKKRFTYTILWGFSVFLLYISCNFFVIPNIICINIQIISTATFLLAIVLSTVFFQLVLGFKGFFYPMNSSWSFSCSGFENFFYPDIIYDYETYLNLLLLLMSICESKLFLCCQIFRFGDGKS